MVGGAPSYEISDTERVSSPIIENDRNVKFFSAPKNSENVAAPLTLKLSGTQEEIPQN